MPVWLTVPPTVARPWVAAASSTTALHMAERSMTSPPSVELVPPVEWPPPLTTMSVLLADANSTSLDTSVSSLGTATAPYKTNSSVQAIVIQGPLLRDGK